MKKLIYYVSFLLLLFIISILPTSAKELKTCVRTKENLHVREKFIFDNNLNDILSTPCIDEVDKVYDFADLLTEEEEEKLYIEVKKYIDESKYDLALVTTDNNPKSDAKAYADDFYDYNYFGFNDTRDGVLLLIDMVNRELYVSTTGYAIKMYDDMTIETILDAGYLYITEEKYYDTFSSMISTLTANFLETYPDSNADLIIDEFGEVYYIKHIPYSIIIIIATLITLVITLIIYNKSVLKIKAGSTISYLKDKKITVKTDQLVNTIVTHTRRANDTSSFNGSSHSSGGGSSFHSSSSGSSHGGGGRKF